MHLLLFIAYACVAAVHPYPRGTQAVVFDIDGTLTLSDTEHLRELTDAYYVPHAWHEAAEVTRAWADKGYLIIYLTGRPQAAYDITALWLAGKGFADGALKLAQRRRDSIPTNTGVGAFKAGYLQYLRDIGIVVVQVYGNAPTDVYACETARIDREHVFMVGPHGYRGHLSQLESLPQAHNRHLSVAYIE